MHSKLYNYINNLLVPCFIFAAITGFFSAIIITVFKILAEWVIHLSLGAYGAVRANPEYIPLLIIFAAVIGLISSFIQSYSHSCRGGGIPTSIAAIRGIVDFRWICGVLLLPLSALLTFLAGLPLGTEGPCVQMGTAVGDGVIKTLGKNKHKGWRRYIMTGGASAGFSVATASPLSAIIFSMEELHKHFSLMLLGVVSISVITSQITVRALCAFGIGSVEFLTVQELDGIPLTLFFAPLIIGIIAGICSILYSHLYRIIDHLMHSVLKKISSKIVLPLLFAVVSVVGFFFIDAIGSGHSLVSSLLTAKSAWYILILTFLIRAIGMMFSNTSGATGGVFLPTLAFGAIIGALCAEAMIALDWIGAEHYTLMVVLGIVSFLGATSRIPLTACVFAIETLGAINATLPLIIAATVSLFVVEASGIEDFTDTMIEAKIRKIAKHRKAVSIEVPLTVAGESFVVGKDIRDVLWPNSCVVVSFKRVNHREEPSISEGDVITVRYITYDSAATIEELKNLVGEQSEDVLEIMNPPI